MVMHFADEDHLPQFSAFAADCPVEILSKAGRVFEPEELLPNHGGLDAGCRLLRLLVRNRSERETIFSSRLLYVGHAKVAVEVPAREKAKIMVKLNLK